MIAQDVEVYIAQATQAGPRHPNEDFMIVEPALGAYGVVDGMSSSPNAALAARTAGRVVIELLTASAGSADAQSRLQHAVVAANNAVYNAVDESSSVAALTSADTGCTGVVRSGAIRSGATMTLILIEDSSVYWAQIGDTRLYHLTPGSIKSITPIHSPVGRMLLNRSITEEDALTHPDRHKVFRCLGRRLYQVGEQNFADFGSFEFGDGENMILGSDGLALSPQSIRVLAERRAHDPDHAVLGLVEASRESGTLDDISVVWISTPKYAAAIEVEHRTTEEVTVPEPCPEEALVTYAVAAGAPHVAGGNAGSPMFLLLDGVSAIPMDRVTYALYAAAVMAILILLWTTVMQTPSPAPLPQAPRGATPGRPAANRAPGRAATNPASTQFGPNQSVPNQTASSQSSSNQSAPPTKIQLVPNRAPASISPAQGCTTQELEKAARGRSATLTNNSLNGCAAIDAIVLKNKSVSFRRTAR